MEHADLSCYYLQQAIKLCDSFGGKANLMVELAKAYLQIGKSVKAVE